MRNKVFILGLALLTLMVLLLSCRVSPPSPEEKIVPNETITPVISTSIPTSIPPTPHISTSIPPTLQKETVTDVTIDAIPTAALFDQPKEEIDYPVPTSPPPLARVEFPMEKIEYPADYPVELRYPDQFILVEINSGFLPGSDSKGWSVSLRYKGSPKDAASLLASFFVTEGWYVERLDLDSGGYYLFVEKDNKQHTGGLIIDPDTNNPEYSLILASVRF